VSAQTTIAKQREVIAELQSVVKSLRAENPEIAAIYDERELLKELLRIREEELNKAATLGDALVGLLKSANSGDVFAQPVTKNEDGTDQVILSKGRRSWVPSGASGDNLAKARRTANEQLNADADAFEKSSPAKSRVDAVNRDADDFEKSRARL
jgi:hypothetical protein